MTRMTRTLAPPTTAPDLWCTYAAVRTLSWLGRADRTPRLGETAAFVRGRRNADGGYAWSKGMTSDAWATFYCSATLADLGEPVDDVDATARWLLSTWSGEAFGMMPGQPAEVWATHFSTRTAIEVCGVDVPDRQALLHWLHRLQAPNGGLGWSPEHAATGEADVRACYYGVAAWRALCSREHLNPPWDVPALTAWLRAQQTPAGGFVFATGDEVPCMWATFRAVGALSALGAAPSADPTGWILGQRDGSGAFRRWPGYEVSDVWASFCAIGALRELGGVPAEAADAVERRLAELSCEDGGFTYREPHRAADALNISAAAMLLTPQDPELAVARRWLEGCLLPNENGIMYMPGRGAEVRCTLWALQAGAFHDSPRTLDAIGSWLGALQNPDGGVGYWKGRGSDLVSAASAVEILGLTGARDALDRDRLVDFVHACAGPGHAEYGNVPGAAPTARSAFHALRVMDVAGRADRGDVVDVLERHGVRGGGWANEGRRMPDLLTTYEAVMTADRFGIDVETDRLDAFLERTSSGGRAAWSPLAPPTDEPMAATLHELLRRRASRTVHPLPALSLS